MNIAHQTHPYKPEALLLHVEKILLSPLVHGIYTTLAQGQRLPFDECPHLKFKSKIAQLQAQYCLVLTLKSLLNDNQALCLTW